MRDTKSLLLLLVSLLLVLVSFVLIWTWGYNYYSKGNSVKNDIPPTTTELALLSSQFKDSLQNEYSATLSKMDKQLDSTLKYSDSLTNELNSKLVEFYRLRSEIASLLKDRTVNNNFSAAKRKMDELQSKVDNIKENTRIVDKENSQLKEVINGIKKNEPVTENNSSFSVPEKPGAPETAKPVYQLFTVSEIRLTAISGEGETETAEAEKTRMFKGLFTVNNFNSQLTNADMYVVLIKPDGNVLKNSGWESGSFTSVEGRKIYSYKFSFNYNRGEPRQLLFTLRAGALTRGNYIMEVYHNGSLIGKTSKYLS